MVNRFSRLGTLGGSAFCSNFYRLGVPEQALGGIPLGFGIVVEDKPSELLCDFLISCFSLPRSQLGHSH